MTMSMMTSVTAVIITCFLFVFYLAYVEKESLKKELHLINNIMSHKLAYSINSDEKSLAEKSIDELHLKDSIIMACLYDLSGLVFASYLKNSNSNCPASPEKGIFSRGISALWIHKDVLSQQTPVGSLYIKTDLKEVRQIFPEYLLFAGIITSLVMCIAFYMSSIFQRTITNPILSLVKTAHNVIKEDNYKVKAVKYANDEIGDLTGAFNKIMLQVRRERENLEMNVFERTQQLEEEKVKAEAVNKAKSEFLRNMSHEFRTPLHGMLSFSTYGINEAQTAERDDLHKYFSRINQVGKRLLKLVEAILSIAHIESGKELFHIEENDLLKTIKSALKEQQALLKERDITVNLHEPNISTLADFDRDKIMQVIINILGNSIKFTPSGKEISIYFGEKMFTRDRRRKETSAITFSIADQGIGVPEDELETIFEKFVQSSRTDTGAGGTGLGLAIASGIVKMHDGIIEAHNNESGGAVFTVTIPRESRKKES